MAYKKWADKGKATEDCERCGEAPYRHRHHYGYVQVVPHVRFLRYFHLCDECHENAKRATTGKQHPLWQVETTTNKDGEPNGIKLVKTDKLLWPDEARETAGKGYNTQLRHPYDAKNAIDGL